jgi:dTDP-4-amino-4,6-dideoxygalactose transaminase
MGYRIWLSPPHLSGKEIEYIREAIDSNWVAPAGPHLAAFEREFCRVTGSCYAAAVSSGTAALHLALKTAGIGRGDLVLCSDFTFIASVSPVLYEGGIPVFIDSDNETWNMDPVLLEEEIKERVGKGQGPKAVIVTHLYGQAADIGRIKEMCERYRVMLLEDAAEALGATWRGKQAGTFGKAGIFSFNGNKIITTSGGGMVVSDDKEFIRKTKYLATQAKEPLPHYEHREIGYNYRMSNILAGIGRAQLEVLGERVAVRRRNFEFYREHLSGLPGISFMPEAGYGRATRWLSIILIDETKFGSDREEIRLNLEGAAIESRPTWKPMHLQPVFKGCQARLSGVSERLFRQGLCLPSGSSLRMEELAEVVEIIRKVGKR